MDSRRDWGHARDYVEGMWKILQQDTPDDFVLSTGVMHSVRQFVEMAFNHVKVKIAWEGEGTDEVGKDAVNNLNINIELMHLIFLLYKVRVILSLQIVH